VYRHASMVVEPDVCLAREAVAALLVELEEPLVVEEEPLVVEPVLEEVAPVCPVVMCEVSAQPFTLNPPTVPCSKPVPVIEQLWQDLTADEQHIVTDADVLAVTNLSTVELHDRMYDLAVRLHHCWDMKYTTLAEVRVHFDRCRRGYLDVRWYNLARHVLAGRHMCLWDATMEERAADLATATGAFQYERARWLLVAEFVWNGNW